MICLLCLLLLLHELDGVTDPDLHPHQADLTVTYAMIMVYTENAVVGITKR